LFYGSNDVQIRLLKLLLPTLEELPEGGIDMKHHGDGFKGMEVPFLEELEISESVPAVIETMGTMVNLEKLSLSERCLDGDAVDAFISALQIHKSSLLPKLQVLTFSYVKVGEGHVDRLFAAMGQETSVFENVRVLKLRLDKGETLGFLTGLCPALERGIFPRLEQLEISGSRRALPGLVLLCQAIETRPENLKEIDINYVALSVDDMRALVDLASSPGLALEKLSLSDAGLTDEAVEILAAALGKDGAFSQLTWLQLSGNVKVTDKACMYLVEAISAGHLTRLKSLSLSSTKMGVQVTKALATAAVKSLPEIHCLLVPEKGSWKEADREELKKIIAQKEGLMLW
jgi:hypothetical protein